MDKGYGEIFQSMESHLRHKNLNTVQGGCRLFPVSPYIAKISHEGRQDCLRRTVDVKDGQRESRTIRQGLCTRRFVSSL